MNTEQVHKSLSYIQFHSIYGATTPSRLRPPSEDASIILSSVRLNHEVPYYVIFSNLLLFPPVSCYF